MYTEAQLSEGIGLSATRAMLAFSYDGIMWYTCELSESPRGEVKYVYTVPPSGWENRA